MMVLSGLLRSTSDQRSRSASRAKDSSSHTSDKGSLVSLEPDLPQFHPYLADEAQLNIEEADDPDLRDLNNSLAALAVIFPDIQVEVFREMLANFDEESRLAVITEALLKHQMKWVRGRYRIDTKERAPTENGNDVLNTRGTVPSEEMFRSQRYKDAVKAVTYNEFKGLSHSTIKAVLAEHNYSYTLSRPTLVALNAKTWRFSIASIFSRRRAPTSREIEHPLVVWRSTGRGSIVPTLKATGNVELDKELFDSLIRPLQLGVRSEQIGNDHAIAVELNNREAEENEALHDCECCFSATTFETLSACNDGGHLVCFRCLRLAINEAVFGQGWARNIQHEFGTLRCLAPMSDDCQGCIPRQSMRRALNVEKGGEDVLRKLEERLAEDSLLKTRVPLVRCPFCSYAEVDDVYLPSSQPSWRFRRNVPISYCSILMILGVGMIPVLLLSSLMLSIVFLLFRSHQSFSSFTSTKFHDSQTRVRRRKHGLRFTCQNPSCRLSSCISCSKAWSDIHICHESSLLALRTQVELAMSQAIKRTCPRCNTSFIKSSGCNKLTCVCGYQMCYVCRKDIGNGEGYRHFCDHFRPNGGRGCAECEKCDLYRCEDDEVVVRKAKEDAERIWLEKEGMTAEGDAAAGKAWLESISSDKQARWAWRVPDWEKLLDSLVEAMIE
ncbi:MAG: hypothetical protein M1818_000920 [Claussenomyces sp. TS43310]|nr:MAG: hypothetical protein M1818_000920 [Claussenomyces sp. TS43310]